MGSQALHDQYVNKIYEDLVSEIDSYNYKQVYKENLYGGPRYNIKGESDIITLSEDLITIIEVKSGTGYRSKAKHQLQRAEKYYQKIMDQDIETIFAGPDRIEYAIEKTKHLYTP